MLGITGDDRPWNGVPINPELWISDAAWQRYTHAMARAYCAAFGTAGMRVLFNLENPGVGDHSDPWVVGACPGALIKQGIVSHGYQLNGELDLLEDWERSGLASVWCGHHHHHHHCHRQLLCSEDCSPATAVATTRPRNSLLSPHRRHQLLCCLAISMRYQCDINAISVRVTAAKTRRCRRSGRSSLSSFLLWPQGPWRAGGRAKSSSGDIRKLGPGTCLVAAGQR